MRRTKIIFLVLVMALTLSAFLGISAFATEATVEDVIDEHADEPKLSGLYLNLNKDVNLMFLVDVPEGYTNQLKMVFSMPDTYMYETNDLKTPLHRVENYEIMYGYLTENGQRLFKFNRNLPYYLGENVVAELYSADADGEWNLLQSVNYSVIEYCRWAFDAYADDADLCALLADLLIYGSETQEYVGHKTNELVRDSELLVNDSKTVAQCVAEYASEYTAPESKFGIIGTNDGTNVADWNGVGLNFSASMNAFFEFALVDAEASVENLEVVIKISDREVRYNVADLVPVSEDNSNQYRVYLRNIMAHEFDEVITVSFEIDGVQNGRSFTYSVNTYSTMLDASASTDLVALLEAVTNFGNSTSKYYNLHN